MRNLPYEIDSRHSLENLADASAPFGDSRWGASPASRRGERRDVIVLAADEPLRSRLLGHARASGYDALVCTTPLDVIDTVVKLGDRVACAILSSGARWADGLDEFLADEHPTIRRVIFPSAHA